MKQQLITTINGINIVTVERDGETFVPIKPICEAIGIQTDAQREKIKSDDFLASTTSIIDVVAADGRGREMFCLPLKYVYGWLATINPGKVAESAREAVIRYRKECYEVLYDHFTSSLRQQINANTAETELLEKINDAATREKDARIEGRQLRSALEKLRAERLNPQPTLF